MKKSEGVKKKLTQIMKRYDNDLKRFPHGGERTQSKTQSNVLSLSFHNEIPSDGKKRCMNGDEKVTPM